MPKQSLGFSKLSPGLSKLSPGLSKWRPGLPKRCPEKHENANNFVVFELGALGKKIYVTTTYSAYKSAKNVFKGTLPLRWLARVLIVHPRQILLVGVVSQGSYCIPQLNPVSWGGQPGLLLIPQLTLVSWGGQPGPIVYHS